MSFLFSFIESKSYLLYSLSVILQFIGTLLLSLFSFRGIKIVASTNVSISGRPVTNVSFVSFWFRLAQFGLVFLLLGMFLAGVIGIKSAAAEADMLRSEVQNLERSYQERILANELAYEWCYVGRVKL